jgi:formamidopyrimidine-DNA glycosylase
LTDRTIRGVGRRGKFILLRLDSGDTLTVHLRMSGRLFLAPGKIGPDKHTRAIMDMDDGRELHFRNPRKFGRMRLLNASEYDALDARLGPEPLDSSFDAAAFVARLRERPRARLKPLLLDQRFLAGLGNIYADEALFRAGLNPLRRAGGISSEQGRRLHGAVAEVLHEAIAAEGTTLSDGVYRFGQDEAGRFAERLRVYGRGDQPCRVCGTPIVRQPIAGRSSHFCPHCQPVPERPGSHHP